MAPNDHTPDRWGNPDFVRSHFDGLAATVETEVRAVQWAADSPEAFIAEMEQSAPPQAAARENMDPDDYARLREESLALVRSWAGGDNAFSVDVEYLLIVARRRG